METNEVKELEGGKKKEVEIDTEDFWEK